MGQLPIWMWVLIGLCGLLVPASIVLSGKPEMQEKLKKAAKKSGVGDGSKKEDTVFDESQLDSLKQTAEEFLEFDAINKGVITFKNDPNYFTMAFGVSGLNISMYTSQERAVLKSGFMNILNTLKEDTQFLVQSRYIDLSKNFEYYKPIMQGTDKEREILLERIKTEKSEVIKKRLVDRIEKMKQRNVYASHIIDFFNYYTKQSDCIYIKIFVVVGHRYEGKIANRKKEQIMEEVSNILSNKCKNLKEQFDSIKLKTYELDNIQTANILYSTMLKNESSYVKLEDAVKNGLLDLAVENLPGQNNQKEEKEEYEDDYGYDYRDEAAAAMVNDKDQY